MRQANLIIATVIAAAACVSADTVVHNTSAQFANGTWSNCADTGSGSSPVIQIVRDWPYDLGSGKHGALSVTYARTQDSSMGVGYGTCSGTAGQNTLTFADAHSVSNIQNGDIILIHQSRGTNVGNWELKKVVSGGGVASGTYTLDSTLTHDYATSGNDAAQVMKIMEYTAVTVNSSQFFNSLKWTGSVGGIMAFMCNGTATINGTINVQGRGYLGGDSITGSSYRTGQQGEGTAGVGTRSSSANGSGGGGGEKIDGSWDCSGGGGGHGEAGGNSTCEHGGIGGVATGTSDLTNMVFGGGGGQGGFLSNSSHRDGGDGGGAVIIFAKNILLNGTIAAMGNPGQDATSSACASGGGAGGSILLYAATSNIGTDKLNTHGGTGGVPGSYNGGTAGAGAGGRVRIEYGSAPAGSLSSTCYSTYSTNMRPYRSSATYTSPAIDITGCTSLDTLSWTTSGGTSVVFRTRTAASEEALASAAWSADLTTSGAAITSSVNPWFQYQATLTGNTTNTPSLTNVSLAYSTNHLPTNPDTPAPANGGYVSNAAPLCTWSASTDADLDSITYDYTLDDNADLSSPIISNATTSNPRYQNATLADGTYYWRVRAYDGKNYNALSSTWSFTVDTQTPASLTPRGMYCDFTTGRISRLYLSGENGTTIRLYDGTDQQLGGSNVWDGSGNATFTPTISLIPGCMVYATSTDAANNTWRSETIVLSFDYFRSIFRDTSVSHEGGTSLRMDGATSYTFKLTVNGSQRVTVTAWLSKSAAYSGSNPSVTLSGLGISGTGAAQTTLSAAANTWQQLTVTGIPNAAGVLSLTIESTSTAAETSVWVDDISVSQ